MTECRVSVILPTYNREKYICDAIESLLLQAVDPIEVLVVDDGSTDNTRAKVEYYGHPIHYIFTENGGPAHARNVGLMNAKGEYVAFLDSDDLYYPYKLELQCRVLDGFPDIGMVYSEFSAFDEKGCFEECHLRRYHTAGYGKGELNFETVFQSSVVVKDVWPDAGKWQDRRIYFGNIFDSYYQSVIVFTNSMMVRRSVMREVGFLNEGYRLFEEMEFALRITKRAMVAYIDIPTYLLRYHADQMSGGFGRVNLDLVVEKQRNMVEIAYENGVKDSAYYRAHRDMVDQRMECLHKAVAVPLMVKRDGVREARYHLEQCARYGNAQRWLWFVTFLPYIGRRVVVRLLRMIGAL